MELTVDLYFKTLAQNRVGHLGSGFAYLLLDVSGSGVRFNIIG